MKIVHRSRAATHEPSSWRLCYWLFLWRFDRKYYSWHCWHRGSTVSYFSSVTISTGSLSYLLGVLGKFARRLVADSVPCRWSSVGVALARRGKRESWRVAWMFHIVVVHWQRASVFIVLCGNRKWMLVGKERRSKSQEVKLSWKRTGEVVCLRHLGISCKQTCILVSVIENRPVTTDLLRI